MQKAVESALPSASVHSLFLSYLTVSLVINQEELVEADKKKKCSPLHSPCALPLPPLARSPFFDCLLWRKGGNQARGEGKGRE